jgi:hypothetical protein
VYTRRELFLKRTPSGENKLYEAGICGSVQLFSKNDYYYQRLFIILNFLIIMINFQGKGESVDQGKGEGADQGKGEGVDQGKGEGVDQG